LSKQINNPLHGITLQNLLTELVDVYGWEYLAEQVEIRCFMFDPSIKSSLKFLRKTQWARDKVEAIYLSLLDEKSEGKVLSKAEGKADTAENRQIENSIESSIKNSDEDEVEFDNPWAQSLETLQNRTSNDKS